MYCESIERDVKNRIRAGQGSDLVPAGEMEFGRGKGVVIGVRRFVDKYFTWSAFAPTMLEMWFCVDLHLKREVHFLVFDKGIQDFVAAGWVGFENVGGRER